MTIGQNTKQFFISIHSWHWTRWCFHLWPDIRWRDTSRFEAHWRRYSINGKLRTRHEWIAIFHNVGANAVAWWPSCDFRPHSFGHANRQANRTRWDRQERSTHWQCAHIKDKSREILIESLSHDISSIRLSFRIHTQNEKNCTNRTNFVRLWVYDELWLIIMIPIEQKTKKI